MKEMLPENFQGAPKIRRINNNLQSNWLILQSLLRENKRVYPIEKLIEFNFKFGYHTHLMNCGNRLFSFIYNVGWYPMDDKCVLLIREDESF